MKIIKTYKDFTIEFILDGVIEDYYVKNKHRIPKVFFEERYWFDSVLFNLIDDDEDGIPDALYGREFQIIFYEVVEKFENKNPQGFKINIALNQSKLIERDIILNIKSEIFAKYAILKK